MSYKEVTVPNVGVIKLYKRRGSRSLRLTIGPAGDIRVSMPTWTPYAAGQEFALSKATWIQEHLRPARVFEHGQRVGKAHHLYFMSGTKVRSRHTDQKIIVLHPIDKARDHPAVQQHAEKAALAALKREADALLPQRLADLAEKHNIIYTDVSTRRLKSRWGSCDSDKRITLNVFLMELPWYLIDYVLLHELAHTRAMNHGPDFWDVLLSMEPRAKSLRAEIRQYRPAFL